MKWGKSVFCLKSFDCNNAFHPAGRETEGGRVKANVHALHLSYIHASALSGTFCACKNQNGLFRELLQLKHGHSIDIFVVFCVLFVIVNLILILLLAILVT
jgi:hypothetical protein